MPQGIQVFNADGSVQFDTTNRLFRVLAVASASTQSGSVTIPAGAGTRVVTVNAVGLGFPPVASISGTTLSWTHSVDERVRAAAELVVMEF